MGCGTCSKGGCNTLSVFDWLDDIQPADFAEKNNIYEVSFKGTRKGFYKNVNSVDITNGDMVVVESDRGYDIGRVSMGGELVRLQMRKKKIEEKYVLKVYRVASTEELKKWERHKAEEQNLLSHSRDILQKLRLNMKMSDVELQADGTKAIFYYTADVRIDFREMIKIMAGEFKIRIEMRQIGQRQEAGQVGGIGSCGRELCCSTWLTEFNSVTTAAARYQNLSLNPLKITGNCGKLKCCLNFELDTYLDAIKFIPDVKELKTELGIAYLQKTDIFKKQMWFSYGGDSNWTALPVEEVVELASMNKKGQFPPSLSALEENHPKTKNKIEVHDFVDVVGQSNLHERPDRNRRKKKKRHPNTKPA